MIDLDVLDFYTPDNEDDYDAEWKVTPEELSEFRRNRLTPRQFIQLVNKNHPESVTITTDEDKAYRFGNMILPCAFLILPPTYCLMSFVFTAAHPKIFMVSGFSMNAALLSFPVSVT